MAKKSTPQDEAHGAIIRGEVDTMRRLIAAGLPLNEPISGERTPLYMAIAERQPAILRLLIEAGADVNQDGTLLMFAAEERQLPAVEALLAAGADVHRLDKNGMSALAHAAGTKSGAALQVVRALIAAGAKGDAEALIWAAREGSPDIVRAVVAAGAQVNEVSRWGTALVLAVDEKRQDNVEALLALGADVNLRLPENHKHYAGKTALDVAKENRLKKILPLLEFAAAGTPPVPAAPAPTSPDDIPTLWWRIKKALDPDVKKSLKKGTTEAKIAALEAKLGVTFPADFRASYLLVNGQKEDADSLVPPEEGSLDDAGYQLLPLNGILDEWQPWVELIESGEFEGQTSSPDPGVRDDWWHRGWIPFASNGGGDSLCLDLAPAEGGTVGQVIAMSHETGDRPVLAKSFAGFLALLTQRLEEAEEDSDEEP